MAVPYSYNFYIVNSLLHYITFRVGFVVALVQVRYFAPTAQVNVALIGRYRS